MTVAAASADGRDTRQRRAIWQALVAAARPLRPDEVLSAAKATAPRLGIATVYRNLRSLTDSGELRVVELPGDPSRRYELASLHHHHHFHCRVCDRVFDVDVCPGQMARHAPAGFVVESHEVVLHGRCDGCVSDGA